MLLTGDGSLCLVRLFLVVWVRSVSDFVIVISFFLWRTEILLLLSMADIQWANFFLCSPIKKSLMRIRNLLFRVLAEKRFRKRFSANSTLSVIGSGNSVKSGVTTPVSEIN